MAYLDLTLAGAAAFGERHAVPPAPAAPEPVVRRPESGFSGLEWSVVALARREGPSTLKEPGRIAKALGSLFGTGRDSRLPDQRLEALRRMAVLAWQSGYAIPTSELRAFKTAGFTLDQYEALQASIGRGRARRRSHSA